MPPTRPLALLAAAALLTACKTTSSDEPGRAPEEGGKLAAGVTALAAGLEQRVTLTPAEPTSGTDVQIRSVIVNRGTAPVELESRICGLTLAGTLQTTFPPGIGICGGYSMRAPLAPGDSVTSSEPRRVTAPAGRYTLRVTHALNPAGTAEVQVTVR